MKKNEKSEKNRTPNGIFADIRAKVGKSGTNSRNLRHKGSWIEWKTRA